VSALYVGPARVLGTESDGRPKVQVLGGACDQVVCDWALPFCYEPAAGDLLLVLGKDARYWVTGIVKGAGHAKMAFRGDATMHAHGKLHFGGDGGVRLDSPTIKLEAEKLDTEADHVVQRIGELDSTMADALQERAGECSRIIDGSDEQLAYRHSTVANHKVKMDAELLRLS
tara:strand:+ start:412 stop:927 length:516 start_codon:yes stop_codon:yes gene_type:complete